jgi:hypothetical protein
MGNPPSERQAKVNPVELTIFSVISLVFLNSVYNLFYDRQGFHPATVVNLNLPAEPGRGLASVKEPSVAGAAPLLLNYELRCDQNSDQVTQAGKLRLTGPLCGSQKSGTEKSEPIQVTNRANRFTATVFTDNGAGKFSTDYIPLNAGKNPIEVLFTVGSGKPVTQGFTVEKTTEKTTEKAEKP